MKTKAKSKDCTFVLKDPTGKPAIVMDASDPNHPVFMMHGRDGSGIVLEINDDSPRVTFKGANGHISVVLVSNARGSAIIQYDSKGKEAIISSVSSNTGQPSIELMQNGKTVCVLQGPPSGGSHVEQPRPMRKAKPKSVAS